jgi:hypothetical protein
MPQQKTTKMLIKSGINYMMTAEKYKPSFRYGTLCRLKKGGEQGKKHISIYGG